MNISTDCTYLLVCTCAKKANRMALLIVGCTHVKNFSHYCHITQYSMYRTKGTFAGLMHCEVYQGSGLWKVNNPILKTKPVVSLWFCLRMSYHLHQALWHFPCSLYCSLLLSQTSEICNWNAACNNRKRQHWNCVVILQWANAQTDLVSCLDISISMWILNTYGPSIPEKSKCMW